MVHEHLAYQSFADANSSKKRLRTKASLQQKQQRQQPQKLQQYNSVLLPFELKPRPEQPVEQPSLHALQATPAPCLTLETRRALQPPGSCTLIKARMATRQRLPHTTVRALPPSLPQMQTTASIERPRAIGSIEGTNAIGIAAENLPNVQRCPITLMPGGSNLSFAPLEPRANLA